jgi:2-dehydro-3-deoxyphosphooctonate aldolase (KDO 8-P synthase)
MKNLTLIAGPCAIEDDQMGFEIAKEVKSICDELSIDYIFKASYRKANRSKNNSFTGIGDQHALEILKKLEMNLIFQQ